MIAARLDDQPREHVDQRRPAGSTGSPAYRAPSGEKPIATSARPIVVRCSRTQNAGGHGHEDRQLRRDARRADSPGRGTGTRRGSW